MLRNGCDEDAACLEGLLDLPDDATVIGNVLDNVEGSDKIERRFKSNPPRIHLQELDLNWMSTACVSQATAVQLAGGDGRLGQCLAQGIHGEAGAAADLQYAVH